jgi:hypothetical protein
MDDSKPGDEYWRLRLELEGRDLSRDELEQMMKQYAVQRARSAAQMEAALDVLQQRGCTAEAAALRRKIAEQKAEHARQLDDLSNRARLMVGPSTDKPS